MRDEMPASWKALDGTSVESDDENLRLTVHQYDNGRIAVLACDAEGSPYCKLTVNLVDEPDRGEDRFWVKLGGAEERLAKALDARKLIRPLAEQAASGRVEHYAELWEIVPPEERPS